MARVKAAEGGGGWTPGKKINPAIDNLRVACGANPSMLTGDPTAWDMAAQNAVVVAAQVERTLDAMAVSLAQKAEPAAAWAAILRKPEAKNWSGVRVAIKVNCLGKTFPRVAIVGKVCQEIIRLGVPAESIVVYDGQSNALPLYGAFVGKGLPDSVVVSDRHKALGGRTPAPVPEPYPGQFECTADVAAGKIDILVNIGTNKGHSDEFGGTTLSLKNHAGTFKPAPLHMGGGMDYLLAINKSEAILGGDPVRQQLCIIDSLWGGLKGPGELPIKRLDRLVMGVFGPAVDYLTAKKIREPMLDTKHPNIERFLTEFGYEPSQMGDLVQAAL